MTLSPGRTSWSTAVGWSTTCSPDRPTRRCPAGSDDLPTWREARLLMVAWRRTDFRTCADLEAALLFATAPRETFERAGTGRKTGTSSREAIRRGHLFSAVGTDVPPRANPSPPPRWVASGRWRA